MDPVENDAANKMNAHPPVAFLVPPRAIAARDLPTVDQYWRWFRAQGRAFKPLGPYSWTLLTYLHLAASGLACRLVHAPLDEGIVIAHRDFLADRWRPGPRLLLVCVVADREEPGERGRHPYAQISVVQNPHDEMLARPTAHWRAHYIPFWPQPGLVPRDATRGDRFEHVAYFGGPENLCPELRDPAWRSRMAKLGLRWSEVPPERWHDYGDVDAVVAVRSFAGTDYRYKPANKLYNAWHAGVPAVLGQESAYRAERQSALDYLEVASVDAALQAVRRLRDDAQLRRAMVDHGRLRARETSPELIVARWRAFLTEVAAPAWQRWCAEPHGGRDAFIRERARGHWQARRRRLARLLRLPRR